MELLYHQLVQLINIFIMVKPLALEVVLKLLMDVPQFLLVQVLIQPYIITYMMVEINLVQ